MNKERIEVRDWYQDPETAPACALRVAPGADLTSNQVRKVRESCPNGTLAIEDYAQDPDGHLHYRVRIPPTLPQDKKIIPKPPYRK